MLEDLLDSSLFGVLLGAGLAYWIGTRAFRRERLHQIFDRAVSAVLAAESARHIPKEIAPGTAGLNPQQASLVAHEIRVEAFKIFTLRSGEARSALAAIQPYCPEVQHYADAFEISSEEVPRVLSLIEDARDRTTTTALLRFFRKKLRSKD